MIDEAFTPGAWRVLEMAERLAHERGDPAVEPLHILWALRADLECRPGQVLAGHGLDPDRIRAALEPAANQDLSTPPSQPGRPVGTKDQGPRTKDLSTPPSQPGRLAPGLSVSARRAIQEARRQSRAHHADQPAGTEHLLLGLASTDPALAALLGSHGLDDRRLGDALHAPGSTVAGPVPVDFEALEPLGGPDALALRRILDASINRAREGLRVVEDYARFGLDDPLITARLKQLRHDLARVLEPIAIDALAEARETTSDVGTAIRTASEYRRTGLAEVVLANLKRTEEALRTIEEFAKIEHPSLAGEVEQVRYELYTVERMLVLGWRGRDRLAGVRLYVLVSESSCVRSWDWTIRQALAGGAQAVQLREKGLADRDLIQRAHRVRALTRQAGALFIVNDRADVARLTAADGVHVGQDDLTIQEARRIGGPGAVVGCSTHSLDQAAGGVRAGADYLGVGPVFASTTKSFAQPAGLDWVAEAAHTIRLPMFAIGGITPANLGAVIERGARRVAVSAAVCSAGDPRSVCAEIRRMLDQAGSEA